MEWRRNVSLLFPMKSDLLFTNNRSVNMLFSVHVGKQNLFKQADVHIVKWFTSRGQQITPRTPRGWTRASTGAAQTLTGFMTKDSSWDQCRVCMFPSRSHSLIGYFKLPLQRTGSELLHSRWVGSRWPWRRSSIRRWMVELWRCWAAAKLAGINSETNFP